MINKKKIKQNRQRRLADSLRVARKKANLKQDEASLALGLSETTINKIENCQRGVEVVEFIEICELYKVSPKKLLESIA